MSNILSRLFSRKKLEVKEPKDPKDHSFTKNNSTKWYIENYCPNCFSGGLNNKAGIDKPICPQCGCFQRRVVFPERGVRKIWNGEKWVKQVKYKTDDHNEIQNKETK